MFKPLYKKEWKLIFSTLREILVISIGFITVFWMIYFMMIAKDLSILDTGEKIVINSFTGLNLESYRENPLLILLDVYVYSIHMFLSSSHPITINPYYQIIPAIEGLIGLLIPAVMISVIIHRQTKSKRGYEKLIIYLNNGWDIIGVDTYFDTLRISLSKNEKKHCISVEKDDSIIKFIEDFREDIIDL